MTLTLPPVQLSSRLSQRVASIPPSGIRKYFDLIAARENVISLGIGQPDFPTPRPIIDAGIASLDRGETSYTSNSGMPALRQALSDHLWQIYGVRYDPASEILITVGVSEGMYLTMNAILDPGDEVIIPEPCFVAYGAEVLLASGVPVYVETAVDDQFQVNADAIEAAITPRTRAIMIGYPNNPTGAVMSRERLQAVVDLAERHNLLVISDEIYDRLVYGVEHVCVPSLPGARERTILQGGFSKDYAMTGWRIGYLCAPADLLSGMKKIHQYTIMSAPTTGQVAAITALLDGEPYVAAMRDEYDRRRRLIVDGFNTLGLDCFVPQGAFYAFPDVRRSGLSSDEFATRLLEEQEVAVIPGEAFGPSGHGYVRAAYAQSYEKIAEALNRIEDFLKTV